MATAARPRAMALDRRGGGRGGGRGVFFAAVNRHQSVLFTGRASRWRRHTFLRVLFLCFTQGTNGVLMLGVVCGRCYRSDNGHRTVRYFLRVFLY